MVGEMANSKRHKLVCCLMAMALLLSFFYVVPDPAGKAERGNAAACVADGQAALTGEMAEYDVCTDAAGSKGRKAGCLHRYVHDDSFRAG